MNSLLNYQMEITYLPIGSFSQTAPYYRVFRNLPRQQYSGEFSVPLGAVYLIVALEGQPAQQQLNGFPQGEQHDQHPYQPVLGHPTKNEGTLRQLVSHRIQDLSQIGHHVKSSSDEAVRHIGQPGQQHQKRSHPPVMEHTELPQDLRNERQPYKAQ